MSTIRKMKAKGKPEPATKRKREPIIAPTVQTGYQERKGHFGNPDGSTVWDFFDVGACRELIQLARAHPHISMSEDGFLDAILYRLENYGEDSAFCSARQAQWLADLGQRGARFLNESCTDVEVLIFKHGQVS